MNSYVNLYPVGDPKVMAAQSRGCTVSVTPGVTARVCSDHALLYLGRLDSNQPKLQWERFSLSARLPEDTVVSVTALASDADLTISGAAEASTDAVTLERALLDGGNDITRLRGILADLGAETIDNSVDVPLRNHCGRYLWLCVEIIGGAGGELSRFCVTAPGDGSGHTAPDASFDSDREDVADCAASGDSDDPASCDAARLPELASRLGLRLEAYSLDAATFRRLLTAAPSLMRVWGTRLAADGVLRAFDCGGCRVTERFGDCEKADDFDGGCELLVELDIAADERFHARLDYVLRQFLPAWVETRIVFTRGRVNTDGGLPDDRAKPGGLARLSSLASDCGALDEGYCLG